MISKGLSPGPQEPCRVCRSQGPISLLYNARDYLTDERFEVWRCAHCGVAFTHPQPTSMNRFYPSCYRQYGWLAKTFLRFVYRWRARSWVRLLGAKGRALEVGCGDGWMIRALRQQGWKVVGNERVAQSTVFASRVNGLPVFVGGLEALKPIPQFDLIILFQALEHLPDPQKTLQHCATLLKGGGALVVAVPNIESWQARLTGPLWFHLDVPRHLFHFSPSSLAHALRRASFSVLTSQSPAFDHDPYGWEQSLLNLCGFQYNLLTKAMMGVERRAVMSPMGFVMMLTGFFLLLPSLLLTLCSHMVGSGALIEVMAVKLAHGERGRLLPSKENQPFGQVAGGFSEREEQTIPS